MCLQLANCLMSKNVFLNSKSSSRDIVKLKRFLWMLVSGPMNFNSKLGTHLACLSKLYQCLEPAVFTGLAQKASKLITKRSTPMDGQLFLIKHLLILREQELEKSLKATREEFIMAVTKLIVDPMLLFVTKVTTVKVSLSSAGQNQIVDSVMGKPLKEQAFATPDKVAELVQKVNTAIQQVLPPVMAKMKLYLQNPSTRTTLFKPVKTNIVEAHIPAEIRVFTQGTKPYRI